MVIIKFISDILVDMKFDGGNDVESMKKRIQIRLVPRYESFIRKLRNKIRMYQYLNFQYHDIFINGNNVYKHNTPLFENDEVIIRAKPIRMD